MLPRVALEYAHVTSCVASTMELHARQPDVKPCSEKVNVARIAQVYFGIDGYVSRKFDLHLVGPKPHRPNETGRPTGGKQLLWIGASS